MHKMFSDVLVIVLCIIVILYVQRPPDQYAGQNVTVGRVPAEKPANSLPRNFYVTCIRCHSNYSKILPASKVYFAGFILPHLQNLSFLISLIGCRYHSSVPAISAH
jgi:hypothetical protein